MSKESNDKRPAFPVPSDHIDKGFHADWRGMTLRDWFAGQALAGVMANPMFASIGDEARIALALDHADKLLAAREAK